MAEIGALVTIATAIASGAVREASTKTFGILEPYAVGAIKSGFLGGLKEDLNSLDRELCKIQAMLSAAAESNNNPAQPSYSRYNNELVLQWIASVREAAYLADNVLDEIVYEEIRVKLRTKAYMLFSGSNSVAFRIRMAGKIRKFSSRISRFYEEAEKIGLKPVKLLGNMQSMEVNDDLRANVDASDIVGRQLDEELIITKLCQNATSGEFSVVVILGMSGVGKTTLARRAYDNEVVAKHFEERIWISVSDNFNSKRLLNEMLESVTKTKSDLSNVDAIERKLHGCMKEKRYLLVLDNVWNTDFEIWDSMRGSLRRIGGCIRSTVLVTARNNEVASMMKSSLTHSLEELCDNDSWMLFKQRAFANKMPEQVSKLEPIGRRIIKKCNGIPLAIKALACLLQSKNEEHEWRSIECSGVWELQIANKIMPSLLLSFNHLPNASLKRCFAFCSVIFRKGHPVEACELIEIWMAQGFLQPDRSETGSTMEKLGRDYINTLLTNGLLQVASYNIHQDVLECRMHDLMHDLAQYVSKETSLALKSVNQVSNVSNVEHLCMTEKNAEGLVNFTKGEPLDKLRTLVWFGNIAGKAEVLPRFLRVLILHCGLQEVPASIGCLKHLRYLDLSKNHFRSLPESVSDLYMLQTLRLMSCDNLIQLPKQITKLVNLRHIYMPEHVCVPTRMGSLTCLQTLPMINLKAGSGWKIEELGCLPRVSNLLYLKGVEHIRSKEEAKKAKLECKESVLEFILMWNKERATNDMRRDEDVMDGLQPHSNLRDLWVGNYDGKKFPPWLSDDIKSHNLKSVSLLDCKECVELPSLGCLPSLQSVEIDGLQSLEVISTDFFCGKNENQEFDGTKKIMFPQLKRLKVLNMASLKDWLEPTGSEAVFPRLEVLEINGCPKLSTAPTRLPPLKKLKVRGIESGQPLHMLLTKRDTLTSLVSLAIEKVLELTFLPEGLSECKSLVDIKISSCRRLTRLPATLKTLHSLETFQVKLCPSLNFLPDFQGLISLRKLTVVRCKGLRQSPLGLESCSSLKELVFSGCSNLKLIPDLNHLAGSQEMQILRLYSFNQQHLVPGWIGEMPQLRVLGIGKFCKEMERDIFPDLSHLPRFLVDLEIKGWPKIKWLPSQIQLLTKLKGLRLSNFDGVEEIPEWLGNLSSLEDLRLGKCRRLKRLPKSASMKRLMKLSRLEIKKCPLLEEACADCEGEEWHKIAHIPLVIVNKKEIQRLS